MAQLPTTIYTGRGKTDVTYLWAHRKRGRQFSNRLVRMVSLGSAFLVGTSAAAELVKVRYEEGLARGFLVLRSADGKQIADGDSQQVARGKLVTTHLTVHFNDGSLYEDMTTFSQQGVFRLLTDHVTERGPTFPTSLESFIDATKGTVTVRYSEKGKQKTLSKNLRLPPDVANGLLFTIIKNVQTVPITVSYVAITPKPTLLSFVITREGEEFFFTGHEKHLGLGYVLRTKVGGIKGILAPLTGQKPAVIRIWILKGEAPSVAAWHGPLFGGGPYWTIELLSPRPGNSP